MFYRKAKPLGHQGVVCSRPQVRLHAGVWHIPGTCPGPDAAWVGASCYYEDGRQIPGKRASPVLWQLLLFSQAWARSGREGNLHVFNNTHESVWVAQGAKCAVCQEDEGRRHPFSSGWQYGCYPLEGQATSGYSFYKCSARDGGSRKEGTRGQEEGGSTQTSSGVQHQHGGRRPGWPAPLLLPCWTALCPVVAIHLLVVAADSHGQLFYNLEPKPPACSNQEGEAPCGFSPRCAPSAV